MWLREVAKSENKFFLKSVMSSGSTAGALQITIAALTALLVVFTSFQASAQGIIRTIAGTDYTFRGNGGAAVNATLGQVPAVAVDNLGNFYASDVTTNLVVKVGPDGILQIIAGNGVSGFSGDGGSATSAALSAPYGLALNTAGDLYVADSGNNRVRKVSPSGEITTVAGNGAPGFSGDGGPAAMASLSGPYSVAIDSKGNLYIADQLNNRIRMVDSAGVITTVAGNGQRGYSGDNGPATEASLNLPLGITIDQAGRLYIADQNNYRVRRVSTTGTITTVAGNGLNGSGGDGGQAVNASLSRPYGLAADSGNLYIADLDNHRVRKVNAAGIITTVAGTGRQGFSGDGGAATSALLAKPAAVAINAAGDLYLADELNLRVRKVNAAGQITTVAGNGQQGFSGDAGPAASASISNPYGVAIDAAGNLYFADELNYRIRKVTPAGTILTVAGNGRSESSGDGGPAASASFRDPVAVAVDAFGNLYIGDVGSYSVRRVDQRGIITTVAGTGFGGLPVDGVQATRSPLSGPYGLATDSGGNLYIADYYSNRVLSVNTQGMITTVAGNGVASFSGDGFPARTASLYGPIAVAVDQWNNLYIDDYVNNRIRKVSASGIIGTVAGNRQSGYSGDGGLATNASIGGPLGVTVDSSGNLYIADTLNFRIRQVDPMGIITTVAGNGNKSYSGDGGLATSAALRDMAGVATDGGGNLYIADTYNHRIREVLAVPPSFQASPLLLRFAGVAGSTLPGSQSITVSSPVLGLAYSASTNAPWLTVTPESGSMPAFVLVTADPSQLSAQSYEGAITIASPYAIPSSITISVTFFVSPAEAGDLALGSTSLLFSFPKSSNSATQQLVVSTAGAGSIGFSVAAPTVSGGSWLSVSPAAGTVSALSPASLTVTASPDALDVGTYSGSIVVTNVITGKELSIPVTMGISPAPQKILLTQSGFTFTAVSQGGPVPKQSLSVANTGVGELNYSVQTITAPGISNWLTISANSGTVTKPSVGVSTIDIGVNPAGLDPGTYYGQIQISSPGASNSPQTAIAALTVLQPGSNPGPDVRPRGLVFTAIEGADSPGSQTVTVTNLTSSPITFGSSSTYIEANGWISYLPANATITSNSPLTIVIQPNFTGLAAGTYHSNLTLQFDDGSVQVIDILAVIAPAVSSLVQSGDVKQPGAAACTATRLVPHFTQVGFGSTNPVGFPAVLIAQMVDDCSSAVSTGSLNASFSNGDPPLVLNSLQNGIWSATWKPVYPAANVTVTLNAQSNGLTGQVRSAPVSLNANQSPPILSGGARSAATQAEGPLAPGDIVLIKGTSLANGQQSSTSSMDQQLAGASLIIGGRLARLLYADSGQIVGIIPSDLPSNSQSAFLVARDNSLGIPSSMILAPAHPAILTTDGSGTGQGFIYKWTGMATTLADSSNPVHSGDTIVIYCTGLGLTDSDSHVSNTPSVTIGQVAAQTSYAGVAHPETYPEVGAPTILRGLVPVAADGLYQIIATLPDGLTDGPNQVVLNAAGIASQTGVTIMVTASNNRPALLVPEPTQIKPRPGRKLVKKKVR